MRAERVGEVALRVGIRAMSADGEWLTVERASVSQRT
jgi:hypothetical protein